MQVEVDKGVFAVGKVLSVSFADKFIIRVSMIQTCVNYHALKPTTLIGEG